MLTAVAGEGPSLAVTYHYWTYRSTIPFGSVRAAVHDVDGSHHWREPITTGPCSGTTLWVSGYYGVLPR